MLEKLIHKINEYIKANLGDPHSIIKRKKKENAALKLNNKIKIDKYHIGLTSTTY